MSDHRAHEWRNCRMCNPCLCLIFDPSDNDEETCACGHPVHDHSNDAGKCRAVNGGEAVTPR